MLETTTRTHPLRKIFRYATWSTWIIVLISCAVLGMIVLFGLVFKIAQGVEVQAWLTSPVQDMKVWQLLLVLLVFFGIFTPSRRDG
jgi:uncharacterized BrkB/YihY/UPF0761 family membrane protein